MDGTQPLTGRRRLVLRLRLALAWTVLVGIALTGSQHAMRGALINARAIWAPPAADPVTEFEQGLAEAQAVLAGERFVGYAFEGANHNLMTLGYAEQTRRFFLAQYALAPVVVLRHRGYPWLFADFRTTAALQQFAAQNGYAIRWVRGGRGVLEAQQR